MLRVLELCLTSKLLQFHQNNTVYMFKNKSQFRQNNTVYMFKNKSQLHKNNTVYMFKNQSQVLAILRQYIDISTFEEQSKLVLNLFTCNCIS
jgi:hypothetical protein